GAFLIGGTRLQIAGMFSNTGKNAVVGAGRCRNLRHRALDVEEMPVIERFKDKPGTLRVLCIDRVLYFAARFVGEDTGVGKALDLQHHAWRRVVCHRQPRDLLLILRRQRQERNPADDAMTFSAPREHAGRTNGDQKKHGQSFAHERLLISILTGDLIRSVAAAAKSYPWQSILLRHSP